MTEVADLNELDHTCFFTTSQFASNKPIDDNSRYVGVCIAISSAWVNQVAIDGGYSNVYARGRHDGVWGEWSRL